MALIYIVEDDENIREIETIALKNSNYMVCAFEKATTFYKKLEDIMPDLVLLDYEMPVVDGRQVLEMIRTETEFSDVPVIFLTSKDDRESVMQVMELRPEGYLLKTMEPAKIIAEVDAFFERQKLKLFD